MRILLDTCVISEIQKTACNEMVKASIEIYPSKDIFLSVITIGEITVQAQAKGKIIPVSDDLIAATAKRHGLHLMTRSISDFEPAQIMLLNPWTHN